jgi:DNA-binding XRE family transcriptional regulator
MSTNMVYEIQEEDRYLCETEDLARVTAQVREGLTQGDVARRLGVSKQAVSKAEDERIGSSMNSLRIRIIQEIGDRSVEGPYWVIGMSGEE